MSNLSPTPCIWGRFCHLWDTFCQWWYSSCYHRMRSRASLADRKNIYFIVVINYGENNSQIWFWHSIFLLSMQKGIFDGALTAGAIGGEPYCGFSNLVASALKPFFKSVLKLRAFICYPLGDKICPTRRKLQYFVLFYWKLGYSGTITPRTIFWAFMIIHNSSQSHLQIIRLVTGQHFILFKKVSFP